MPWRSVRRLSLTAAASLPMLVMNPRPVMKTRDILDRNKKDTVAGLAPHARMR